MARNRKIKTQKEIARVAQELKKKGQKIVVYNGSFDLLHLGHINALKESKSQGDVLIVLVNSDESIGKYKGPNHPIVPQKERIQTIASLGCVDYAVVFDEITPKKILGEIKPDVYCKSPEWGRNCVEREVIEKNNGKIHVLKWVDGLSTAKLVDKILRIRQKPEIKAIFLDRDGTINKIDSPEYIHKVSDFRFFPGAIEALKKVSKTDYRVIILTNQSGIGRGYFKEKDLKKLHKWMLASLGKRGARIDKIYYCPHAPGDGCGCRKPAIGMVLAAVKDFGINLSKSWMIGDGETDIIMGREANVKTIKIGQKMAKGLKLEPNYYAEGLLEAVNIVLKK